VGDAKHARNLFAFSILYLFALFAALLAEANLAPLGLKVLECRYERVRIWIPPPRRAAAATSPWAWAWRRSSSWCSWSPS
jgi:hypothetical protein